MRLSRALSFAVLAFSLILTACAPNRTGSTIQASSLGAPARVEYGTIVGMRPVQVQGSSGIGTVAGAVAGGLAGSAIGGDWRANALAGLGGAMLGGLAGGAVEQSATSTNGVEFIIRLDRGGDISVVQTNEEGLQAGERVALAYGQRARVMRAAPTAAMPAPSFHSSSHRPMSTVGGMPK